MPSSSACSIQRTRAGTSCRHSAMRQTPDASDDRRQRDAAGHERNLRHGGAHDRTAALTGQVAAVTMPPHAGAGSPRRVAPSASHPGRIWRARRTMRTRFGSGLMFCSFRSRVRQPNIVSWPSGIKAGAAPATANDLLERDKKLRRSCGVQFPPWGLARRGRWASRKDGRHCGAVIRHVFTTGISSHRVVKRGDLRSCFVAQLRTSAS